MKLDWTIPLPWDKPDWDITLLSATVIFQLYSYDLNQGRPNGEQYDKTGWFSLLSPFIQINPTALIHHDINCINSI